MDRRRHPQRVPGVSVPRTRGDGPVAVSTAVRVRACSPHTRGWTEVIEKGSNVGKLFPAHAGMDRLSFVLFSRCAAVPRTRGDGPISAAAMAPMKACSPHTRGWTDAHQRRRLLQRPVPRTRGDGPRRAASWHCSGPCSPHTRGWTEKPDHDNVANKTVPRTRGDGPHLVSRLQQRLLLFPAHAGMDRTGGRGRRRPWAVPRTRGDGPALGQEAIDFTSCSPHTRGWTG